MTVDTAGDDESVSSAENSLKLSHIEAGLIDEEDDEVATTATDRQVRNKTRVVLYLKITVFAVLVIAGLSVSLVAFFKFQSAENSDFEGQFKDTASKLIDAFYHDTQMRLWTTASLSTSFTSFALADNKTWPNITLPDFRRRTTPAMQIVSSPSLAFCPMVTNETREGWEAYARMNLMHMGGESDVDHNGESHGGGNQGDHEGSHSNLFESDKGDDHNGQVQGIVKMDPRTGGLVPADGMGPFYPAYQMLGENTEEALLFDMKSVESIREAIDGMVRSNGPSISNIFESSSNVIEEPFSVLAVPIFEDFDEDKIVAAIIMEVAWNRYFGHISLSEHHEVVVVIENTCGQVYSLHVKSVKGHAHEHGAAMLHEGDHHNPKYDHLRVESSYEEFEGYFDHANSFLDTHSHNTPNTTNTTMIPCLYAIRIYPHEAWENNHFTNNPRTYSMVCAGIFAFTILVFVVYDLLVERRQTMVAKTAAKSNAILHSLFPANVRDRLFKHSTKAETKPAESQGRMRLLPLLPEAPTSRLKTFLSNPTSSRQSQDDELEPIADLFPNTTVMFADIAGFTAWSSEREPHQVFRLLETLYDAFDKVARALGVFKVETIGDAYVAVTGLPDPADDHAVVMARFAYECQKLMRDLTKELEVSLGPGTADLSIRVGLHSGPVTAGVLRGDKSRFQLFGDTVNTAARMESTSAAGKIQISQDTADLLVAAGRSNWLRPREERVWAKGKGEMQTYWIKPGRSSLDHTTTFSTSNAPSNESKLGSGSMNAFQETPVGSSVWGELDVEKIMSTANPDTERSTGTQKEQRLIDWNVEVLYSFLVNIVGARQAKDYSKRGKSTRRLSDSEEFRTSSHESAMFPNDVIGEVTEVVSLAEFDPGSVRSQLPDSVAVVNPDVRDELRHYVTRIASLYRPNVPFHNFEHASHVTMSANKLIKRIVAPQGTSIRDRQAKTHHNSTFGISTDPLAQFAVVFSALIHDVDHTGLPNAQLVKEKAAVALAHNNKSVAEQQSVYLGWTILMEPQYKALRSCIYSSEDEQGRFRQLVINSVMATDLVDKDLQLLRKARWAKSFDESALSRVEIDPIVDRNRKATIVIEHLIQASDVAHTMQHWHTYRKWNERLFEEQYRAFITGHAEVDPSVGWYKGEIWFFDNYVIPLARKLKDCGVFGVSSDEYLAYASENRREWETKGLEAVQSMMERVKSKTASGQSN